MDRVVRRVRASLYRYLRCRAGTVGHRAWLLGTSCGGGGEWVPVLSLAEEEQRVGPLWTLSAKRGTLVCIEVGECAAEPQPPLLDAAPDGSLRKLEDAVTAPFGHGGAASVRELPWRLPLGPVPGAQNLAEETLREQLLNRHVEEMSHIRLLVESDAAGPSALGKGWRTRAFQLFGQLARAGEVERALDVAKNFLVAMSKELLRQWLPQHVRPCRRSGAESCRRSSLKKMRIHATSPRTPLSLLLQQRQCGRR